MTSKSSIRVFFAIWPRGAIRSQLYGLSRKLELSRGERRIRVKDIHLTLVFLGEIRVDQLGKLYKAVNAVRAKQFNLIVDRMDYWKSNRLICAKASVVPLELLKLVDSLKAVMHANGFSVDDRAFIPHITLARNIKRTDSYYKSYCYNDTPIFWPINELVLVKSEKSSDGSSYKPIRCWTLISVQR